MGPFEDAGMGGELGPAGTVEVGGQCREFWGWIELMGILEETVTGVARQGGLGAPTRVRGR